MLLKILFLQNYYVPNTCVKIYLLLWATETCSGLNPMLSLKIPFFTTQCWWWGQHRMKKPNVVIKNSLFFTTQHWWGQYRLKKPNVVIKNTFLFTTQHWWGQYRMKKPNVDIKNPIFSQPNVDGDNIVWKKPNIVIKNTFFFTTQLWWDGKTQCCH